MTAVPQTVLIVDDHPGFRAAARALLQADGFTVVGEAGDGADALDAVVALRPDIVLLDVGLPGPDGIEVAAELTRRHCSAAIVLISSRDRETYGTRLANAPAIGFLAKRELSGGALARLLA
jgi:DNA-binding NarL/FixJ family response regulator